MLPSSRRRCKKSAGPRRQVPIPWRLGPARPYRPDGPPTNECHSGRGRAGEKPRRHLRTVAGADNRHCACLRCSAGGRAFRSGNVGSSRLLAETGPSQSPPCAPAVRVVVRHQIEHRRQRHRRAKMELLTTSSGSMTGENGWPVQISTATLRTGPSPLRASMPAAASRFAPPAPHPTPSSPGSESMS